MLAYLFNVDPTRPLFLYFRSFNNSMANIIYKFECKSYKAWMVCLGFVPRPLI